VWAGSMALRFTAAGALLAARCIRILYMNQHARLTADNFWNERKCLTCRALDGIMLHGEHRGSLFLIHQQKAAVIGSISHLFSATVSAQCVFLHVTHLKYVSARKSRRKFQRKFRDERVPSTQTIHNLVNKLGT
jgi:hypothetical protein